MAVNENFAAKFCIFVLISVTLWSILPSKKKKEKAIYFSTTSQLTPAVMVRHCWRNVPLLAALDKRFPLNEKCKREIALCKHRSDKESQVKHYLNTNVCTKWISKSFSWWMEITRHMGLLNRHAHAGSSSLFGSRLESSSHPALQPLIVFAWNKHSVYMSCLWMRLHEHSSAHPCDTSLPSPPLFFFYSHFFILDCPWFPTSSLLLSFSLSPPSLAANPSLLPPLHPLLPEGFQKLLRNALQIIKMHVLWIRGDTAVIMGWMRSRGMKLSLAVQIKRVNLSCPCLLRLKEIVLSVAVRVHPYVETCASESSPISAVKYW